MSTSKTIRACFLSHMFPNSLDPFSAPFMLERAKALSLMVDINIVAPVPFFPFLKSNLPPVKENFKGIQVYHPRYLALPMHLWAIRWVTYLKALAKIPQSFFINCNILHIEWIYPDAYAAVRLSRKYGIKTVGIVHGNEAIEYYGPRRYKRKYIEAFAALDKIIVVSNDLKNKLINEYSVKPEKIEVILNGVDVEKFFVVNKENARAKLGIPMNTSIGVCVARLSAEKNLDILIKAVAKLRGKSPDIYIVGDGPLKKELSDLINHYGVSDKVTLVGSVPHEKVALWLGACDFFCLPSQREGCPVVIHEALACGRPVISTTVGAIPDLVCKEDYGLLCPPYDVDALAHLIEQAVDRTWDAGKISSYGRQFTWEKMARETVAIYNSLLHN